MKYYSNFFENKDSIKGLFQYFNKDLGYTIINNTDIVLINGYKNINRIFHNNNVEVKIIDKDISDVDNIQNILNKFNIIGKGIITNLLDSNENLYLSGTLLINSRVTFGTNKRNIPTYEFIPTNKKFTNFIVSSNFKKNNNNSKDIYVLIKFKEWKIDQKKPIGTCEQVIGEIGIIENEYENILYNYNINYSNYKKKEIEKYQNFYKEYYENNSDFLRDDYTQKNIFSIDPENCKDIDDAIHLDKKGEYYEIGIHIADVTHFILENSYIDNEAKKRGTTIYAPHKIINMLPNIYSENLCSLKPNEIKKAFSIIMTIDSKYNIINSEIKKTLIESKKAFSYEEANTIINKNSQRNTIETDLNTIFKITKKMNYNMNYFDTHNMIELLMIKANEIVAKKIFDSNKENCILRIHEKKKNYEDINSIEDNDLKKYLNLINSQAAVYNSDFENNQTNHYGLNTQLYTHFTSPIRRYIDIIVHRILNQIINNEKQNKNWQEICNQINVINNNIKKCDREIEKINFIKQNINNEIIDAYITEIKQISNKIQIFIKNNNMAFNINIFSEKLKDLIICDFQDNYFEISYKNKPDKHRFYLLQKIKILVSTSIEAKNMDKKCIMSLLDKDNNKIIDLLL